MHYTASPEELPSVVETALAADAASGKLRRAYALLNAWDHRAARLEALLDARMPVAA